MTWAPKVVALGLLLCAAPCTADAGMSRAEGDRAITKVIKLLQEMMVKSKADGEEDTELFGKFKCYCDTNQAEKIKEVAGLAKSIELLGGEIDQLVADNGKLSKENAQLEMEMGDNERARSTADNLRAKANEDFISEEADMKNAMGQMDQAILTLGAIGTDEAAEKASFMAKGQHQKKASLLKISTDAQTALKAVSAFLPAKLQRTLTAFIQAPIAGAQEAQSGAIVGILKSMRDTFKSNLAAAKAGEKAAGEAHEKFSKAKTSEFDNMKEIYDEKESVLSQNDDNLGSKRIAKEEAQTAKASDEEFLGKLKALCEAKTKDYENRRMIRTNEDTATAQAITILNSDESFDVLGGTAAATTGATELVQKDSTAAEFLQLSRRVHRVTAREMLQRRLAKSAQKGKSLRLARIAAMLESGNPFDKVEGEVNTMIELIAKEEQADQEQKAWCDNERESNDDQKGDKQTSINTLNGKVTELTDSIENEETGLRYLFAEEETTLAENQKDQKEEIEDRAAENGAYQKTTSNLAKAEVILEKATKVLQKFYDWLHAKQGPHHYEEKSGKDSGGANLKRIAGASTEELEEACSADPSCVGFNSGGWLKSALEAEDKWYESAGALYVKVYDAESPVLLQRKVKEDPAPPPTFEEGESYKGQTEKGSSAVSMLEFILEETRAEAKAAHDSEAAAQIAFEDTMNDLKAAEGSSMDTIADLKDQLAQKEDELAGTNVDLKKTMEEHKAIEKYLLKIKPGCDFITTNIDMRKESRAMETEALKSAMGTLKETPIYKKAASEDEAGKAEAESAKE